jgi:ribosomal RNA assembly protein
MEQILIPVERAVLLDRKMLGKIESRLHCKIGIHDQNEITIDGEPYDEYNAKNILLAFGRGFGFDTTLKLLSDSYYFKHIDLRDILRNREQVRRIKARIIGEDGRAMKYIESVSETDIAIYGDTISLIGTIEGIHIATVAIEILLGGGTHKTAYKVMEDARRKAKEAGLL